MKRMKILKSPEKYRTSSISVAILTQHFNLTAITTDVLIVGGGIKGITSAYLLVKQGVKASFIETDETLNGTTGHTTVKITVQHGLIFNQFITDHSEG